jgi:Rieske Fe-S protein
MTDASTPPPTRFVPLRDVPIERRRLLGCAALFGVAGPLLVACGDDTTGSDGSTGSGGSGEESPNGDGGGAAGEVLVATADVPVGGGVILTDLDVAVTQPSEGEFLGFDARCTHQGTTIGEPRDGIMTCPLHGSQFGVDGENLVGPNGGAAGTTGDLVEIPVEVQGDNVVRA